MCNMSIIRFENMELFNQPLNFRQRRSCAPPMPLRFRKCGLDDYRHVEATQFRTWDNSFDTTTASLFLPVAIGYTRIAATGKIDHQPT